MPGDCSAAPAARTGSTGRASPASRKARWARWSPRRSPARSRQYGYYGYRFRLLYSQGPDAPGGAYDYLVKGRMLGGFAVIAWPVR